MKDSSPESNGLFQSIQFFLAIFQHLSITDFCKIHSADETWLEGSGVYCKRMVLFPPQ